jgi:putative ABC transport system substrate-binding protein
MRRRGFIAALGGAAAWPLVARAQDAVRRIGVLMNFGSNDSVAAARNFRESLNALGWIEGRNAHIEVRWSQGDYDRIREYVAELMALSPDVIVATTSPAVRH